jgi:hypothetical protein
MAEQMKISVKLEDLRDTKCPCGCGEFSQLFRLKVLPGIYTQSGRAEHIMQPVGFVCRDCRSIIPLLPIVDEDKKVLTFPGREN